MKNHPKTYYLYGFICCMLLLQLPFGLFSQVIPPRNADSLSNLTYSSTVGAMPCGTDILLSARRKDAAFVAREQAMNNAILQQSRFRLASRTMAVDYTLPVVFHIINANPSSITDAAVLAALQAMNDAFSASGTFTGGRTDTRIQFCLAKTDPNGGKTTGIIRTKTFLGDYDYDMEGGDMTALGRWDPARYVNIWVVEDIKSEYMQTFECGVWTRLKMGGYASAGGDIVVAGLGTGVLCHETGHYLSLDHTFANRDCANFDCATTGDRVCDTPPERTITGGYPCGSPPNSCSSDTLSGFATDVPDLPDNFMDYGNGTGCILGFTEGQAQRMRDFIATGLTGMIGSTVCTDPCPDIMTAGFTTNIDYPVIGDVLNLTNTSTGAASYQWLVDGVVMATTTDFTYTVTEKKNYTITLRAYGSTAGCFTAAQFIAQTSCGVTARFWPNKRVIASKENIQLDSVLFTNRSIGATSYQWLFSNNVGMAETVVSTSFHLNYVFLVPATYRIRLIASNGTCSDTSNYFTLRVYDSSPDAGIGITAVECYNQTKVRINFWFYNNGYKTIPKNTPVTFYNRNPNSANAQVIGGTPYLLPYAVTGHCSSFLETYIVDVSYAGLDTLYAVINDSGTTIPLALPNTPLVENIYTNNTTWRTGFKFHINAIPANITLAPFQNATLTPLPVSGGGIVSAVWSPASNLSCTNCLPTIFNAPYRGDTAARKKVMAYSRYGCYDTAIVLIHIPPADDYTINITKLECAANGDSVYASFTICNSYPNSDVPASLKAAFYDANPLAGAASILGAVFVNPSASADSCTSYTQIIKQSASGTIYAVVNDNGTVIPVVLPSEGILEKNYTNNVISRTFSQEPLFVVPADTTIFRNETITLGYNSTMIAPTNPIWQTGPGYTLTCTNCAAPQITAQDSATIQMQVTSRYGCTVTATGKVNIFPPDMTVEILGTTCITNDSTRVRFRICMNNRYNNVFKNIPVSFYDGAGGKQLYPVFNTASITPDTCAIFTHIIATPSLDKLSAVVNDRGTGMAPSSVYNETDYTNNTNTQPFIPFSVSFSPNEIELNRPSTTTLVPLIAGGIPTSYKWLWAEKLSCYDCASPVATTVSTTRYQVKVTNENSCTDTSIITIKTFTNQVINIPTAFTPDGNGQNDVFYVIGTNEIKLVKDFAVYNRWGQQVFHVSNVAANDKQFGWNGKLNGVDAAPGGYVYAITIELAKGNTEMHKGVVMLIR